MSHRRRPDLVSDSDKGFPENTQTAVVFHDQIQLHRAGVAGFITRSVETIPESVEAKVHPNATRV